MVVLLHYSDAVLMPIALGKGMTNNRTTNSVDNCVDETLRLAKIANTPLEAMLAEPSLRAGMPPNTAWGTRTYKDRVIGHDPNCSTLIGTTRSQRLYCSCGLFVIPFVCWPLPPDIPGTMK